MEFWITVVGLLRRGRVVIPAVLVAATCGATAFAATPVRYVSSTTMVLTTTEFGGTESQDPANPTDLTNPMLNFSESLRTTSAILIEGMNTGASRQQLGRTRTDRARRQRRQDESGPAVTQRTVSLHRRPEHLPGRGGPCRRGGADAHAGEAARVAAHPEGTGEDVRQPGGRRSAERSRARSRSRHQAGVAGVRVRLRAEPGRGVPRPGPCPAARRPRLATSSTGRRSPPTRRESPDTASSARSTTVPHGREPDRSFVAPLRRSARRAHQTTWTADPTQHRPRGWPGTGHSVRCRPGSVAKQVAGQRVSGQRSRRGRRRTGLRPNGSSGPLGPGPGTAAPTQASGRPRSPLQKARVRSRTSRPGTSKKARSRNS